MSLVMFPNARHCARGRTAFSHLDGRSRCAVGCVCASEDGNVIEERPASFIQKDRRREKTRQLHWKCKLGRPRFELSINRVYVCVIVCLYLFCTRHSRHMMHVRRRRHHQYYHQPPIPHTTHGSLVGGLGAVARQSGVPEQRPGRTAVDHAHESHHPGCRRPCTPFHFGQDRRAVAPPSSRRPGPRRPPTTRRCGSRSGEGRWRWPAGGCSNLQRAGGCQLPLG
jgi:hypothetical protein